MSDENERERVLRRLKRQKKELKQSGADRRSIVKIKQAIRKLREG